jgi:hypothetical protein
MINKESQIRASFEEVGSYLVSSGKYDSAVMDVKNPFQYDKDGNSLEVVTTKSPMETIQEPKYKHATRNITMSNSFVEMCLTRPKKPHNKASYKDWELYNGWNKISDEYKIQVQLEKYAHDINCELTSFEII